VNYFWARSSVVEHSAHNRQRAGSNPAGPTNFCAPAKFLPSRFIMDTKEQLVILSEICRQDLKIVNSKEELNRLNRESKQAQDTASELLDSISNLNVKKDEQVSRRRALDEKLLQEKANLRKWEARAGKIRGERDYTALMSEISAQKRTINGIEIEISEVNNELKSTEEKLKRTSGAHEEQVLSANRAYDAVKELLANAEENLQKNEIVRNNLLEKIPKPLRVKYERIYERRSYQGIAFLRNGVCQACMRTIPPELFIRVLKGEIVEQCPSCQRILVANLESSSVSE
jgi:uncharacterized protein